MKKTLIILVSLLLMVIAAGCANDQTPQQPNSASKQSSETTADTAKPTPQQAASGDKQGSQQLASAPKPTATKAPDPTKAPTKAPDPTSAPAPAKTPTLANASTPSEAIYDLVPDGVAGVNVTLNYPQLSNLADSDKQNRINDLIRTVALEIMKPYEGDEENLSLNVDYEVKYKSPDLLSIQYVGLANVQGAAHPNNLYCTTNIDLKAERQLTLGDVVTVNDEFVKQFLSGKYTPYSSSLNLQSKGALEEALASLDHQTLLESFKQPSTQFYFTDTSLGVSVEVAHALGDHLEMEIGYETLGSLLLVKP
ncbi:MAG: PdaC/SigV domain-containing protein [Chloroflexota bacterium]|jgi:hypothetical protein